MSVPDKDSKLLTIYPQRKWHHNAYIVGNRNGLLELRNAIDEALSKPEHDITVGLAVVEPLDAETYYVAIVADGHEEHDVDTAYWDDSEEFRGNSMVPNERYIMAVGEVAAVRRVAMIEENRLEIEAAHREQKKAKKKNK